MKATRSQGGLGEDFDIEARIGKLLRGRDGSLRIRGTSTTTSSAAAGTSCGPNDTSGPCQRYVGSTDNTTVPIVIGVVVPVVIALVIFLILHRRHVKKLRQEDVNDADRDLDFGLDTDLPAVPEKKVERNHGLSAAEARNAIRHDRGLSMDMAIDMNNPYILAPEVHQSRESLHSLSRIAHPSDDKYRTTTFIPDDGSIRSPSIRGTMMDDASSFTGSTRRFDAQPRFHGAGLSPTDAERRPLPVAKPNTLLPPTANDGARDSYVSTASNDRGANALRKSNDYLGRFIRGGQPSPMTVQQSSEAREVETSNVKTDAPVPPQKPTEAVLTDSTNKGQSRIAAFPQVEMAYEAVTLPPPRQQSKPSQLSFIESYDHSPDDSGYASTEHTEANKSESAPTPPQHSAAPSAQHSQHPSEAQSTYGSGQQHEQDDYYDDYYEEPNVEPKNYSIADFGQDLGYDPRHLSFGVRPLPPDDPSENPEQRANRIRSFYKEYFDETNLKSPPPNQHVSYFDGSEAYPAEGPPQPYEQRGQQPPRGPRGPAYRGPPPQGRHRATVSNGSYLSGSRTYSAHSGQFGTPQSRRPPQKRLPPPQPLNVLPNPSMIKDDNFSTVDFAPPNLAKVYRTGTPDSAKGGKRPYTPSIRAHNPLVSSYDDLTVMPSPHGLRNSGTYTGLDFAPPRFANPDTGSDAGSMRSGRSNRSGVSALHAQNIRQGAYRIERLPKDTVGARDDLATALRPKWDIR